MGTINKCVIKAKLLKSWKDLIKSTKHSPWHGIRNPFGVSELVRTGGQLAKVPTPIIQALMQVKTTPLSLFQRGEMLRVADGPFRNLQVVYEMQDGDHRAIVLIELLNKMQKIAANLNALSKQ